MKRKNKFIDDLALLLYICIFFNIKIRLSITIQLNIFDFKLKSAERQLLIFMKFYLVILALLGATESSGCSLTLGSLGNKLGYGQGINTQKAQSTNYACFPISTQTQPIIKPTKVSITVTPNHVPIPVRAPSQTYV